MRNWAAQNGIVEVLPPHLCAGYQHQPGTDGGHHGKLRQKLGYDLPKTLRAVTFADNAQISSWAKNAVKVMQQAGILAGKANNRFDPRELPPARRSRHRPAAVCEDRH